jgi:hypothetical protein
MKPPIPAPTDTQLDPFYGQELRRIRKITVKALLLEWSLVAMCSYYVLFLVQHAPVGDPIFTLYLFK